jgi:AmmeMemoRadiSam system protein B
MDKLNVRPPAVAGMFYPHDNKTLMRQATELLERAKPPKIKGELKALISPHAGYEYSGLTAAHGYKLLENKDYDVVVIISPSHQEYFKGVSAYPGVAYRTPLGDVSIDLELQKEITEGSDLIKVSADGHGEEHAVEVQLPFLQTILEDFKILPLVIGDQSKEICFKLGEVLGKVLKGKNALIVASTDLSHYHPYDVAKQMDKIAIDDVVRFDYEKLFTDLDGRETEACGGGPTAAAMIAAKIMGANKAEILHAVNSGDMTGEKGGVVGYMSAALYKSA